MEKEQPATPAQGWPVINEPTEAPENDGKEED